jgi:hypothetical protein
MISIFIAQFMENKFQAYPQKHLFLLGLRGIAVLPSSFCKYCIKNATHESRNVTFEAYYLRKSSLGL